MLVEGIICYEGIFVYFTLFATQLIYKHSFIMKV